MKAVVVLSHPYDKSFNHAVYRRTLETLNKIGVSAYAHDLYKDRFNPVLTKEELGKEPSNDQVVIKYTHELLESDLLIFIHPNWWGQPPAILKGYIDRIFRPPHTYDFPENDSGGGLPIGKLNGKTGIVFNTSNTEEVRENSYFNDPLQSIWEKCVFGFCGITDVHRKMFRIVADSTHEERTEWLNETEEIIREAVKKKIT